MRRLLVLIKIFFFSVLSQAKSSKINLDFTKPHVTNQIIVKFKNDEDLKFIKSISAKELKKFRSSGALLLALPKNVHNKSLIKRLETNESIEFAGLNYKYKLLSSSPNDEDYGDQYAHDNISSEGAWAVTTGSRDIKVAVIDSGIDYNHEDLKDNYWYNEEEMGLDSDGNDKSTNGVDDDNNGYVDDFRGWDFIDEDNDPMDGNGHGTHCAGIIGASGNNGIGVVGINWEVSLIGIKVFSTSGETTTEALTEGIEYSTLIGANISNNSWGGSVDDEPIRAAIEEARDEGILFVAAAGNNRSSNDNNPFFPASHKLDNIVSVLSTTSRDRKSGFSNHGISSVHVGAPGSAILSTFPNSIYRELGGTSMAAPYVTGLLALAMSEFPDEDYLKLKNRIMHSGDKINDLVDQSISGRRINASEVFSNDSIAPASVTNFELVSDGWFNVKFQYDKVGDDGLEGEAKFYDIRWSNELIDEENWAQATNIPIKDQSDISDTRVEVKVKDVFEDGAYIGVRAIDEAGNMSENIKVIQL